ncbi:MAG TPA: hydroxymethylbilane synthase [Methylomirabilota bacterium]|nr:hydroxymethylbilane synthase [Methylomirabilota bacterium]
MAAPVYLASRGSALALAQANLVLAQCRAAFPDGVFELRIIKTTGDRLQTASLASGELPKGLFTKELEVALGNGEADLAVHSLKDLPTELPPGLKLGAVCRRADVRDVLIYRDVEHWGVAAAMHPPVPKSRRAFRPHLSISSLPHGAVVGTSSTRRTAQLLERRPDLRVLPLRGNVGTRLRKLVEQPELDAILLAAAGLDRLGITHGPAGLLTGSDVPEGLAMSRLPVSEMLPCVGQAAIGLEVRAGDARAEALCARLNDPETLACVTAERAFLSAMGGGCHLAVAAYAQINEGELRLQALSYLSGRARRTEGRAPVTAAETLGRELAKKLLT